MAVFVLCQIWCQMCICHSKKKNNLQIISYFYPIKLVFPWSVYIPLTYCCSGDHLCILLHILCHFPVSNLIIFCLIHSLKWEWYLRWLLWWLNEAMTVETLASKGSINGITHYYYYNFITFIKTKQSFVFLTSIWWAIRQCGYNHSEKQKNHPIPLALFNPFFFPLPATSWSPQSNGGDRQLLCDDGCALVSVPRALEEAAFNWA